MDFGTIEDKENASIQNNETPPPRRSKSFKRATRHNPLLLSSSADELDSKTSDSLLHDSIYPPTKQSTKQEFSFPDTPVLSNQANNSPKSFNNCHGGGTDSNFNEHSDSLSRNSRYSSMPVLNVLEPSSPIIHRNRKCSEDITRHESTSSVKKRIFDTKLYFQKAEMKIVQILIIFVGEITLSQLLMILT